VLEPEPEQQAGGAAAADGSGGRVAPGGLAQQLAEMGVSSDVASHLESSTYFKMTARGTGRASGSEPERLNTYRAGDMLRQVSATPVRLLDGQESYEVQSPYQPDDRGLVPVAHCSPLDESDLIQLAFSLQDPDEGHFPTDEKKQEFYAWAASKGIEQPLALSALDRQISKGGELSGRPVHDAKAGLRQAQAEERAEAVAAAAAAATSPVAAGGAMQAAAAAGAMPAAGAGGSPVRRVDFFWDVVPDRHGRRQQGGPGDRFDLTDDRTGGVICLTIPVGVRPGTQIKIEVEINARTGEVRELFNSVQTAPISSTPRRS
jgi:hypothetical protein